jgi:pimeloyl-ACP methyl ester carboxylesterase
MRKSHERLTASIKGAVLVVAEKSGHMMAFSRPDFLVSAVLGVVRLAK